MAESDYIVRLKWPEADAFKSAETLQRALAARAGAVDELLANRAERAQRRGVSGGGRIFGDLFRRVLGPTRAGPSAGGGGGGGGGWIGGGGGGGGARGGDVAESWHREGEAAWRGLASPEAAEELAETEFVRVDREVPISLPPPVSPAEPPATDRASQLARIGLDAALRADYRGDGVRIAILDSGLDSTHPDFATARIDSEASWDWYWLDRPKKGVVEPIARRPGAAVETRHFHGTAVAGLLGGRSTGVAPGSDLIVHNVFYERPAGGGGPGGDATLQGIQLALMFSHAERCDIFVMSLGTPGYNPCFEEEVASIQRHKKDALIVAASGNSGPGVRLSPGDYRNVLTVGAVDWEWRFWPDTSGAVLADGGGSLVKPDIYAPGHDLELPVPTAVDASGYLRKSGTSFATPIVAGVAALVLGWYRQRGKTITTAELREHLLATSAEIVVPDELGGTGRLLDPGKALAGLVPSVPT